MKRKRGTAVAIWSILALAAAGTIIALNGCSPTFERRNPMGERFPSVVGTSLADEEVRLPEDFAGEPLLLLVGYRQNSQFDLDRWLLGLRQAGADVEVREVPTIPGLLPGLFAGRIDSGMRTGIPSEDWAAVITVYDDAEKIARFTGNETPLPGRILLLDGDGRVVYFHDEGYSVGSLERMMRELDQLDAEREQSEGEE